MTTTIKIKIKGMECPNCAMRLEQLEDTLKGVLMVEASYRKAEMVVQYNDSEVTLEQIKTEVRRLGYEAAPE